MPDAAEARFVILHHVCPADSPRPTHYDLMLEHQGVLLTWALVEPPHVGRTGQAQRLADHRLAYLDFEGELSGGRGSVTRWDRGSCSIAQATADEVVALVEGKHLCGQLVIRREQDGWSLLVS